MLGYIITLGILIIVIGFGGWTFTYALRLALNSDDTTRIDPVPTTKQDD